MALVWGRDHHCPMKEIDYLENLCKFTQLVSGWAVARIHKPKHFLATRSRVEVRETQATPLCPAPAWGSVPGQVLWSERDGDGQQCKLQGCKLQGPLTVSHCSEPNLGREAAWGIVTNFILLSNQSVPDSLVSLGGGRSDTQVRGSWRHRHRGAEAAETSLRLSQGCEFGGGKEEAVRSLSSREDLGTF